jgi:LacI family transcriptional regulator of maltose regulon
MQAAQMLTEHLIRRGHQRIAWLGGKSSSLTAPNGSAATARR